jgi:two-component system KDP operon response regulator KdpE
VLRRMGGEGAPLAPVLRAGDLELDLEHRTLRKAGRIIHLSPKEFELLAFLMQHANVPIIHARLMRTIRGPEYRDETEYLRSYVKTLRKKIEDDPAHPEYILTEPWVGYRFRDPFDPDAAPASSDLDDAENDLAGVCHQGRRGGASQAAKRP